MEITAIRIIEVTGTAAFEGPGRGEPIGKPQDVYPEYRPGRRSRKLAEGPWQQEVTKLFVRVETDEGLAGQFGPVTPDACRLVKLRLERHLLGADPLAGSRAWDVMFRTQAHAGGLMMHAIAAVDCALWDLRGRQSGLPVYRLLGGPTRNPLEAYAQTKGLPHDPDDLLAEARRLSDAGWRRLKVFLNYGPADGRPGMQRNVAVLRTLREGLGDGVELMVDVWRSWDLPYALEMVRLLAPLGVSWLEEPLMPRPVGAWAELRRRSPVPIAGGEHACTRWEHKRLLDAGAVDVLQPDPSWAGGLTETLRIVALASAAGVRVCPHTNILQASAHLAAACSPAEVPLVEVPVFEENYSAPFFLADPVRGEGGTVVLPEVPGLGMELDESKVASQREAYG
jgi:L-alanine-DL-glutamate epimerase-like enolase superfamily enzyme